MRLARLIPAAAVLLISGSALAQGWFEYRNTMDLFAVNMPAEPRVEEFTYVTEYGSHMPARRYIADYRGGAYTMTVVDMRVTERGRGRQGTELRGSIGYAATQLRHTGDVTYDAYGEINVIPGHQLQITLPDGRRNFVQIMLHYRRLYIAEAIVPGNQPPPALFQASIELLDEQGNVPRYQDNDYSFPDHIPRGGGGGGGAAGAGGGAGGAAGAGGGAPAAGGGGQ